MKIPDKSRPPNLYRVHKSGKYERFLSTKHYQTMISGRCSQMLTMVVKSVFVTLTTFIYTFYFFNIAFQQIYHKG